MTGAQLTKLFAWVIGALLLLWMLAECLGGESAGDSAPDEVDREGRTLASDCRRAWEALELMGTADHGNVGAVVDEIEILAGEIADPALGETVADFGVRTEEMVDSVEPGDQAGLGEEYLLFRSSVESDLSARCAGAG